MNNNTSALVTSASNKFFPSLINLLGSLHVNYPNHPDVYVYNLGLFPTYRKELEIILWVHILEIPHFVKHWRKCYTWKTYILNTPINKNNLYLDAGCQVMKPLDELFKKIDEQGYLAVSQGNSVSLRDITPNDYIEIFDISNKTLSSEVITAGIFGFKVGSIISPITKKLYNAGVEGLSLGFSESELWKNKGINRTPFIRDCKMFRHDTTLLSILFLRDIGDAAIEPIEYFSAKYENNSKQLIWNLRLNYKGLDFLDPSILHQEPKQWQVRLNRYFFYVFIILKSMSNKVKNLFKIVK